MAITIIALPMNNYNNNYNSSQISNVEVVKYFLRTLKFRNYDQNREICSDDTGEKNSDFERGQRINNDKTGSIGWDIAGSDFLL
ncbi:hypothetical protein SanaruYs_05670 [Chryseotalea sanaruensis]|uniref:Uncharacterized protein n=1 Tax=Chryseotalea sanaruensis TaxID=2482724 RepID=A0A401U668_9BACT|nr:hypothetical protein SanaruYs_05670 [Chryseotalea sanaruensis]